MKRNKIKLLSLAVLSSVALTGCYIDLGFIQIGEKPTETDQPTSPTDSSEFYDVTADRARIETYYSSFDTSLSGDALLNALKTLNLSKRTKEVTYKAMGTSGGPYRYTDYDPATAKLSSEGIPYGSKISSFYSGKSTTVWNREHVWPDSRGGGKVEDDIYMTRPTITEENSDRGNATYRTGMADSVNGWDPVEAFADNIGVFKNVRGECARIIFYCMTAADGLVLNDVKDNQKNNMGSITNLVEWACENPVTYREKRRNVGGQHLQGNRNAFVDHPEYVCRIWGNTNITTKSACQRANYATN